MTSLSDILDDTSEFVSYPLEFRLSVFEVLTWADSLGGDIPLDKYQMVDGVLVHMVRQTVVNAAVNHILDVKNLLKINQQDKQHERKAR